MKYSNRKPLIRYRFKDAMGCVFYKVFYTDREARLWYERNKSEYLLRELGSVGVVHLEKKMNSFSYF